MANLMKTLLARYADLSARERLMLAVATLVVSYFAIDWLLLTPQLERRAELVVRAQDRQVERNALQMVLNGSGPDVSLPRSNAQDQQDALQATVSRGEQLVRDARSAQAVTPLLQSLVSTAPGVELTALRSAPATVFYQTPSPTQPTAASPTAQVQGPVHPPVDIPTLYSKTIDVRVTGNYLDLLRYLQSLANSSQTLYWDSVSVAVASYPAASMTLVLKVLTTTGDTPVTAPP